MKALKWELKNVPLDKLVNPKTDLRFIRSPSFKARIRHSLTSLGIIEPLKVRVRNGLYEIIDGKTRKEDLIELGYVGSVPCLVTECTDDEALTLQCVLSMIRRNLDPVGFARFVRIQHDKGKTLSEIGKPFHLKKAQVSKYLALNKLGEDDKLRVARREISVDEAYAIVRKKRVIPEWARDRKPKSKPCPHCGELIEDVFHATTTLCPACIERLQEAISRERKFKQDRF